MATYGRPMTNPVDGDPNRSLECDRGRPIARGRFDPADPEEPAATIVDALSAVLNVPATELTPLYDRVDLESLGRLIEHARTRGARTTVEFPAVGHGVRVSSAGIVVVCGDGGIGRASEGVEAGD